MFHKTNVPRNNSSSRVILFGYVVVLFGVGRGKRLFTSPFRFESALYLAVEPSTFERLDRLVGSQHGDVEPVLDQHLTHGRQRLPYDVGLDLRPVSSIRLPLKLLSELTDLFIRRSIVHA